MIRSQNVICSPIHTPSFIRQNYHKTGDTNTITTITAPLKAQVGKTKLYCHRELCNTNLFLFTHHWSLMRRAVKANAKRHYSPVPCYLVKAQNSIAQHFGICNRHLITAGDWDDTFASEFVSTGEELNTMGGYIHRPRRGVFGLWHCPLEGEAMHSLSHQLGQTHSEAWGWGPGCGLPDASLRSAEGWTGSLDSVDNGRDTWMEEWTTGVRLYLLRL